MTAKPRARIFVALAAALTLALAPAIADARPGKGGSLGSRGSRTFEAPPATNTAPRTAAPMERSATQAPAAQRPAAGATQPGARTGFASRGFMGGLLGAGLFGLLLGYGFMGGFGGLASILGLLLQVALIGFLIMLAVRFFQRRQQPAFAGGPSPSHEPLRRDAHQGGGFGGLGKVGGLGAAMAGGAAGYAASKRPAERRDDVGIKDQDYQAFEQILVGVQDAYSREDARAIRAVATPEMTGYFTEELEANRARGVVNRIADVKLVSGDLAEAWRESGAEYATLALGFTLRDWTEDRNGRVVEGNPEAVEQATEVWTFRRVPGGPWLLSAVQQA